MDLLFSHFGMVLAMHFVEEVYGHACKQTF